MASNWWNFDHFQQHSQQLLSNEIRPGFSQFFRRPAKIVKSTSRSQSPRTLGRRRMTTQMPTRTRSVMDPSMSNRASQWLPGRQHPARPTSWHPMSIEPAHTQDLQQPLHFTTDVNQFSFHPVFATANVNGLATPLSYPVMDDSQINELVTPLDELSASDMEAGYFAASQFEGQFYPFFKPSSSCFNDSMSMSYAHQPYWTSQYSLPQRIPTAPASPEFLAMPDVGDPFDIPVHEPDNNRDELVGMGLYDSPAEVQTSSLLFGGGNGMGKRKSLKLEESFEPQPPSDSGADEQAQDDADADADADVDSNVAESFDDAEGEPVLTIDVPVMEDRVGSFMELNMVNGIQQYLGSEIPIASNTHPSWI